PEMEDEEVVAHLTQVKGIGRWTAEMVLLFTLERPDVYPIDDQALRVAVERAYGLPERPGHVRMLLAGEPWRPFRSAASHYLWRSLRLSEAGGTSSP
ncbi:MAG: DNA-3-methyladenine glycosylase 2 family protein, partial [Gemmatimonadota bacterium]|nr:DNA-3-methyladenine glycosylase 2 family protein [Gemmatimonadota bacterium]